MSSAYTVWPVTLPNASTLGSGLPMMLKSPLSGMRLLHPLRRQLNGLQNFGVARAAAEVPGERLADFLARWIGVVIEQRFGRDEDARRAIAALGRAQFGERGLERVECPPLGQALDRQNLAALNFDGQGEAGEHRLAVHEHRARAALAQLTAVLRPGEMQITPP